MRTCVNAWSIVMVNQNNKQGYSFSPGAYTWEEEKDIDSIISQVTINCLCDECRAENCHDTLGEGLACDGGFSEEVRLGRDGEGEWGAVAGAPCMRWHGEYEVWRLGVSPGKHGARGGHGSGQGPCDRTSLLYEQWVPVKGVKREDGQLTSILWKEHSGSSKGRCKWTWEVTELALTQVAVEEIHMALTEV